MSIRPRDGQGELFPALDAVPDPRTLDVKRHRGLQILAIADDTTVTVIEFITGEILSTHTIEPDKNYWRNSQRAPGRWPGAL